MLELRNEAVASLSIPFDIRLGRQWEGRARGTVSIVFDAALERYARSDATGVSIHRVADGRELKRLPSENFELGVGAFSPNGQFLVLYGAARANGRGSRLASSIGVGWRRSFSTTSTSSADHEGKRLGLLVSRQPALHCFASHRSPRSPNLRRSKPETDPSRQDGWAIRRPRFSPEWQTDRCGIRHEPSIFLMWKAARSWIRSPRDCG